MVRYGNDLAESMKNDNTHINMYGIEIQTKGIPGEPRSGVLDPREYEIQKGMVDFFKKMASGPRNEMSVEGMREMMGFPNLNMNMAEIYTRYEEHDFDGNKVKMWIYYPRRPTGKTNRPGFIYLHGGGFIGGTPFNVENPCRLLAERADCVVFNIDYSLAPEKPYPNGFNDCFSALRHIYENAEKFGVDKNKLGIGGDSAGGNLAAVCAMKDRDLGTSMLKYQVLLYPTVTLIASGIEGYEWRIEDYTISEEQKSLIEPGLMLGRPKGENDTDDIAKLYLQHNEEIRDPYISPLLAKSHKGLCKTLIAVAEFDGLRIQGEIYGKKLMEDGVDTRIIRYKGVGHAFLDKLGVLPQAEDVIQEIANDIIGL